MVEPERVAVPADPRDFAGAFRYRRLIEVRFADTDAMGHVNNAAYLTYCEMARAGYYEQVTGRQLPLATHGASESMILAEARITYRSPAFFGETLTIEGRVGRVGRTSFTQEYRLTAPDSRYGRARLIAVADSVQVMYDYVRECPIEVPPELVVAFEAFEGRRLRPPEEAISATSRDSRTDGRRGTPSTPLA
ncbi:MAG TPA: thioesterase family protein [Candidatus Limnocylindrales bacterium]